MRLNITNEESEQLFQMSLDQVRAIPDLANVEIDKQRFLDDLTKAELPKNSSEPYIRLPWAYVNRTSTREVRALARPDIQDLEDKGVYALIRGIWINGRSLTFRDKAAAIMAQCLPESHETDRFSVELRAYQEMRDHRAFNIALQAGVENSRRYTPVLRAGYSIGRDPSWKVKGIVMAFDTSPENQTYLRKLEKWNMIPITERTGRQVVHVNLDINPEEHS